VNESRKLNVSQQPFLRFVSRFTNLTSLASSARRRISRIDSHLLLVWIFTVPAALPLAQPTLTRCA
jgi:hypothetical protein